MRKTEVYQIRLDSQEKKQAFAVFKQLGITPAQAVRLFFKQVVITRSIPFSIENQHINLDQLTRLRKIQQEMKLQNGASTDSAIQSAALSAQKSLDLDDDHLDLFEELNAILGEGDKS